MSLVQSDVLSLGTFILEESSGLTWLYGQRTESLASVEGNMSISCYESSWFAPSSARHLVTQHIFQPNGARVAWKYSQQPLDNTCTNTAPICIEGSTAACEGGGVAS